MQTAEKQIQMIPAIMEVNMINLDRRLYDDDIHEWAFKAIDRLRPAVFLGPRQLAGRRFNDTEYVFIVLESMTPQATFEKWPLTTIDAALRGCADADYWYAKEKSYSDELEDSYEN